MALFKIFYPLSTGWLSPDMHFNTAVSNWLIYYVCLLGMGTLPNISMMPGTNLTMLTPISMATPGLSTLTPMTGMSPLMVSTPSRPLMPTMGNATLPNGTMGILHPMPAGTLATGTDNCHFLFSVLFVPSAELLCICHCMEINRWFNTFICSLSLAKCLFLFPFRMKTTEQQCLALVCVCSKVAMMKCFRSLMGKGGEKNDSWPVFAESGLSPSSPYK